MTQDEMREKAVNTLNEIASGESLHGISPTANERISAAVILIQLSEEKE